MGHPGTPHFEGNKDPASVKLPVVREVDGQWRMTMEFMANQLSLGGQVHRITACQSTLDRVHGAVINIRRRRIVYDSILMLIDLASLRRPLVRPGTSVLILTLGVNRSNSVKILDLRIDEIWKEIDINLTKR
jgi:hypothetical protein